MEVWAVNGKRSFYRAWLNRTVSPSFRRTNRLVAKGHAIPPLPRKGRVQGSVWAISMVKNEADIIESFVNHVFSQGIDQMLVVDNASSDGTVEKLHELSRRYPLILGRDHELAYYQAHKMSRLAGLARRAGADWILPMDADEFWFAEGQTVAAFLRTCSAAQVAARLFNGFPTHEQPRLVGLSGTMRLDLDPGPHGKAAARAHPGMWIKMGNHQIERPGVVTTGLSILHLPWRSLDQFRRKVIQGNEALEATDLDAELGVHWRSQAAMTEETLLERWRRLLDGLGEPGMDWSPGPRTVVHDVSGAREWSFFKAFQVGRD